MEYLPIRRAALKKNGLWELVHWPLHRGRPRDLPSNATLHGSTIRRMKWNPDYRPGNIIVGSGGRRFKKAPAEYGMGQWAVSCHEGDPIRELYTKNGAF